MVNARIDPMRIDTPHEPVTTEEHCRITSVIGCTQSILKQST